MTHPAVIKFPAVAAEAPASLLPVSEDAALGHGNDLLRFTEARPVDGVAPYKGWQLLGFVQDGQPEQRDHIEYVARSVDEDVLLGVSRFFFDPTPERFRWLVDHKFPSGRKSPATGVLCPLTNADIDDAIEAELIEANRKHRVGLMNFAAAVVLMLSGVVIAALGVAAHG